MFRVISISQRNNIPFEHGLNPSQIITIPPSPNNSSSNIITFIEWRWGTDINVKQFIESPLNSEDNLSWLTNLRAQSAKYILLPFDPTSSWGEHFIDSVLLLEHFGFNMINTINRNIHARVIRMSKIIGKNTSCKYYLLHFFHGFLGKLIRGSIWSSRTFFLDINIV